MSDDEVRQLRAQVAQLRAQVAELERSQRGHAGATALGTRLSKGQVERYARHITLRNFGLQAQERLCGGSALVIGAGGLGCPCALYLAASGVGHIGIADKDTVSLSNLHRQVAHTEARVGQHKVDSAYAACRAANSTVCVSLHRGGLTPENAAALCARYDVVVDCSDNAPTRYLANDACVVAGRSLVSGAAVGTDGQLSVYNCQGGPCYRCLFPECPEAAQCTRCEDAGVLGPVPGVIGTLQALEAIKILSGIGQPLAGALLSYDALAPRFTRVRLRGRRADCFACGGAAGNGEQETQSRLAACGGPAGFDYAAFTGGQTLEEAAPAVNVLQPSQRLGCEELRALLRGEGGGAVVLYDVRPRPLFEAAHIEGAVNVPIDEVQQRAASIAEEHKDGSAAQQVVVVCRKGNDSQMAASMLIKAGVENVRDLQGGLHAWARVCDDAMPLL